MFGKAAYKSNGSYRDIFKAKKFYKKNSRKNSCRYFLIKNICLIKLFIIDVKVTQIVFFLFFFQFRFVLVITIITYLRLKIVDVYWVNIYCLICIIIKFAISNF